MWTKAYDQRRLLKWAHKLRLEHPGLRTDEVTDEEVIRAIRTVPTHYYLQVGFRAAVQSAAGGANDVASNTTTETITKPAGTANTDILAVVFGTGQTTGTAFSITPPAGWTAIFTGFTVLSGSNRVGLFGFWALGSVSALGFTCNVTAASFGWEVNGYTGVDNTTPIDVVDNGGTNHNTGASSLTVNAVTIATANAMRAIHFSSWLGGTNSASGFTVKQNVTNPPATNADATAMFNQTPSPVGSTGTTSVSSSASATGQILAAAPFALRPQFLVMPGATQIYQAVKRASIF